MGKVIAKQELLQKKKAEEKSIQRAYFAFQEKWIKNNIHFT
jgi:hypothetical protein